MSEPEPDSKNTTFAGTNTVVQLPAFPENTNVRIFIDGKKNGATKDGELSERLGGLVNPDSNHPTEEFSSEPTTSISSRGMGAMVSGAVGAVAGLFGGDLYVKNKLFAFEAEVEKRTRADILGRRGLGAAIAETSGSDIGATFGSMGPGMASHEIRSANAYAVVQEGNHEFAKFIYTKLGGNKSLIPLAAAAVVGTITAGAAYSALKSKNTEGMPTPENTENANTAKPEKWADKIEKSDESPARTL